MNLIRKYLVPVKIAHDDLKKLTKFNIIKNYLIVCISMCFFLISINGINSVSGVISKNKNLGLVSQALYYGIYGLSAFLLPQILINFMSFKWTLISGYSLQLFFVCFKVYPNWPSYLSSSFLGGLGSALVWTCSSFGVNQLCKLYIDITKSNAISAQSLFFGIFGAFLQFSSFLGNLLSAVILQNRNKNNSNMTALFDYSICGKYFCSNTKLPESADVNINKVYLLIAAFSVSTVMSVIISVFMDNIIFFDKNSLNLRLYVKSKIDEYKTQVLQLNQLLVLPVNLMSAFLSTFIWADFSRGFAVCSAGVEFIGWSMMCLSGVSALFSPVFGKIASKLSIRIVLYFYYALIIGTYSFILLFWKSNPQTIYFLFILAILLGIIESINIPQPRALYGILFKNEVSYSVFNVIQGTGFLMSFILSTFSCVYIKVYVILSLCCLSILCDLIRNYREWNRRTIRI